MIKSRICYFFFLDSVANTIQSTVDTTQKTAQSLVDTGKTYASSAKGKFLFRLFYLIFFFWVYFKTCQFVIDTVADTVSNSVGETKNIADSTTETAKSYVDSAKGRNSSNFVCVVFLSQYLLKVNKYFI